MLRILDDLVLASFLLTLIRYILLNCASRIINEPELLLHFWCRMLMHEFLLNVEVSDLFKGEIWGLHSQSCLAASSRRRR